MTGALIPEIISSACQRSPGQRHGFLYDNRNQFVVGVQGDNLPLHDRAVAQASSTPLAGAGLATRIIIAIGGRMRTTIAAGRLEERGICISCRRRYWHADERTDQQNGHYAINGSRTKRHGNVSQG
jgi:hypothetical protein